MKFCWTQLGQKPGRLPHRGDAVLPGGAGIPPAGDGLQSNVGPETR